MKQKNNEKYMKTGLTAFLVIAASIVFYYLIFHNKSFRSSYHEFISILNPILYGVVLAYILNPLMQPIENGIHRICRKNEWNCSRTAHLLIRFFSAFASFMILFFIIYGLVSLLIPQLVDSIRNIIRNYPIYEANVIKWVNKTFGSEDASQTTQTILTYADKIYDWAVGRLPEVDSIVSNVTQYVFGFFRLILNLIIGIIIALYILISKETMGAKAKRLMYAFMPVDMVNRILHNLQFVDEKLGGFIIGKVIDSAIIGVLCYICMQLMKMPYTVLIAVVIGVTNIIPFFGPFIGAVPCAILVFVISPLKSVYFVLFILLLQQFDGNILGPKILGNSTGLSGFMVVIAIVICNGLFGIGGTFFGVPLTATLVGVLQAYIRKNITKKGLPKDLVFYDDLAYIDESTGEAVLRSAQDSGNSLYDKIKRQDTDLSREGILRFRKRPEADSAPEDNTDHSENEESGDSAKDGTTAPDSRMQALCASHHRKKKHKKEIPDDPVNISDEEASGNHNLPLVR